MAEKGILTGLINVLRLNQKAVIFTTCVLLSMVFWLFTSLSRTYETRIGIPVSYRNLPFTQQVQGELPTTLEFHFKGTGFDLFRTHLRNRPDSVIIDVSKALDKEHQFKLSTLTLRNQFPGDTKAFKIVPELIAPNLNQRSSKRVPVHFNAQLSFRNRFGKAGNVILSPDSIDLAGDSAVLEKINFITSESVQLSDIEKNHFGSARLLRNLPKGVTASKDYIYFYIPVQEYTEGTFEIAVELPVSQRNRVTLIPEKVKVSYMAPLIYFKNIKPSDFILTAEIPRSSYPQRLEVKLVKTPPHLGKVKIDPELIDYFIHQ